MKPFLVLGWRPMFYRWLSVAILISLPATLVWFIALPDTPTWGSEIPGGAMSAEAGKLQPHTVHEYVEGGRRARSVQQKIQYFNQALKLDPNSMLAYFWRGIAYYEDLKEYDQALADFNRTISLNPGRAANYVWRAKAYSQQKAYDKALADLNHALVLDPKSSWVYCTRGLIYSLQGNYDQALEDLDWALVLDLFNGEAYFERGKIHLRKKAYDIAVADFSKSINLFYPDKAWQLYNYRAQAYEGLGESAKSQADWDKAKKLNPHFNEK
jgi:tetratricopeptide (TPR) repeat protein